MIPPWLGRRIPPFVHATNGRDPNRHLTQENRSGMERAPCPIVKMVLTDLRDTSCHLRSSRLAWRLKRRPIGDDGPRALYPGTELDSVSEVHAVAALERWRNHYAGYRVLHLSDWSAIPQLCTCFDEPVARIESTDPRMLRYPWRSGLPLPNGRTNSAD